MRLDLPPGYRLVRSGGAQVVAREDAVAWVEQALAAAGTLRAYAEAHAERVLAGGRGPVPVVAAPRGPWAVRHYRRGGAAAALLGDRYFRGAALRPFAELAVSEALRRHGVATPEVHAAGVYPAGAWYRGDVATTYIPDAGDLAELTLSAARWPEAERVHAWRAAGALLSRFFATGAVHADLNLRNVLVSRAGPVAHLLDLDRCTPPRAPDLRAHRRMRARFERSRRKLEARAGRPVGAAELDAFEAELQS